MNFNPFLLYNEIRQSYICLNYIKVVLKMWGGRRYYSLDCYLKETFGEKLYKLSLDGGMTCPNRDGKISYGGCIFCSEGGSGEFAATSKINIDQQIQYAKSLIKNKFNGNRYIAYFQSYTNTYASVEYLRGLFMPVIMRDDIAVLSIATRPDCLDNDIIKFLEELVKIKPVWIELGLQTVHQKTADFINRGYGIECYNTAVKKLKAIGVNVITHMIIGLPYETKEQILQTADYIGKIGSDGIKLQLMHILKNTKLEKIYNSGAFNTLSEDEYVSIVADIIEILPENIVIHRLTGDGDKNILVSPLWSCNKRRVLNKINHELKLRNINP